MLELNRWLSKTAQGVSETLPADLRGYIETLTYQPDYQHEG